MRARIVSDLHFDLHRDDGHSLVDSILSWSPEECLIIAGDLCELRNFFPSISRAFRRLVQPYEHVIYIMGNHEYYGRSPKEVLAGCANIRRLFPSVRIPEDCSTIEIAGGKRMHCATL
jgi:predicted MPP superfamily phosphohydrolase